MVADGCLYVLFLKLPVPGSEVESLLLKLLTLGLHLAGGTHMSAWAGSTMAIFEEVEVVTVTRYPQR